MKRLLFIIHTASHQRHIKEQSVSDNQPRALSSIDGEPELTEKLPRILVVDDSYPQRFLLQTILSNLGYEVAFAENGQLAINILADTKFDLVISDQMMPVMDGHALCRAIRDNDALGQPYVIMHTSADRPEDLILGMESGADDFMHKPANKEELIVRIAAGVRISRMRAEIEQKNHELSKVVSALKDTQSQIDQELRFAATLQQEFVPRPQWLSPTMQFESHFATTRGIGGDSMGIVHPKQGQTLLYQIDVMGHGIASAMLTFALQNAIQQMLNYHIWLGTLPPLHQFARRLNERFPSEQFSGLYFTLLIALIDEKEEKVRYCQAGHPHPCVITQDGEVLQIKRGSFPVGLFDFADYETRTLPMPSGSTLMISTDGLFDTQNTQGLTIGRAMVEKVLVDSRKQAADLMMESVVSQADAWRGTPPLSDDVSVMLVKRVALYENNDSAVEQPLILSISPNALSVSMLIEDCDTHLKLKYIEDSVINRVNTVLVELLNNIVEYNYTSDALLSTPIDIQLSQNNTCIKIKITEYSGPPPHLCPPKPLDLESEGGRGLHIIQAWTDQLRVRRIANANQWTLMFKNKHNR
jgi:sigma-B regulation protein RsbU (phosphoserine phosphatase)